MRKGRWIFLLFILLLSVPALGQCRTRALLVACKEFISQPDLGSAISGNLHMIGSTFVGAGLHMADLSIEDGTIGTQQALESALHSAFSEADETDLSILYLCTHGVLTSADDEQVYLLLGDGQTETPIGAQALYALLSQIQGEKLLVVDACYSGALLGRGMPSIGLLPGAIAESVPFSTPFLADPSIHVLTSANGYESSWYYDSDLLTTGAVSYFASALSTGLGLYGTAEADANGDGMVTLSELHRYLSVAVPSSSSQLLSVQPDSLRLPVADGDMLSRPLTGFSYGDSLLISDAPTLDFSFTVTRDTSVQYRLIDFADGRWNWETARTFLDTDESGNTLLRAGRKSRSLTLSDLSQEDSGYLMLQIFSVSGSEVILCSERLIAVQPAQSLALLSLSTADRLDLPGLSQLPIDIRLSVPAEVTVSVFASDGTLVCRLASSQLTRPAPGSAVQLYWDGRDSEGNTVTGGRYIITAEALIGVTRQKAAADVSVGS